MRISDWSSDVFSSDLFDTRRGFCEHYSSAFTFLMRAAGIPARIVTGYQGGERNAVGGYYVVSQSDAHAWSEVWYDGDRKSVGEGKRVYVRLVNGGRRIIKQKKKKH